MRAPLSVFLGVLLFLSAAALTGCGKKKAAAEDPPAAPGPIVNQGQNPGPQQQPLQPPLEQRGAGVAGAGDRQNVQNDMKQIGLFYIDYRTTHPRGPATVKAFADSFRRQAPQLAAQLDKGIYAMFLPARQASDAVVAYDVAGNTAGQHIVVMGDGSVQTIAREQLQQYWKQNKR